MCQARGDGGRRCPIHRHDSVAYIQLAEKDTGLAKRQVENIFRELSREGRHTPDPTEEQWRALLTTFKTSLDARNGHRNIKNNVTKAFDNFSVPDGKTYYALQKLANSSKEKADNLALTFNELSREKGMPLANIKRRYSRYYNAVDVSRGAETPEHYSQRAYLYAKNNNLPYDKASVVALEQLRNVPANTTNVNGAVLEAPQRRVEPILTPTSSFINSVGYNEDGGRLEVTFQRTPDAIYAYQNVPVDVWNQLVDENGNPQRGLSSAYSRLIRNTRDYQYSNNDEAERDSVSINCELCGQFASPVNHRCPERVVEEVVEEFDNNIELLNNEDSNPDFTLQDALAQMNNSINAIVESENASTSVSREEPNIIEGSPVEVDPNAYNSINPQALHQVGYLNSGYDKFAVSPSQLIRINNLSETAEHYYTEIQTNYPHLDIYSVSPDNVRWNGFEDELRANVRENTASRGRSRMRILISTFRINDERHYVISKTFAPDARVLSKSIFNRETESREQVFFYQSEESNTIETLTFTDEEQSQAIQEFTARNISILEKRSTATRNIIYDRNLKEQHRLNIPKVNDIRRAYAKLESGTLDSFAMELNLNFSGKAKRISLESAESSGGTLEVSIDDQGYPLPEISSGTNVTGPIEFKKNDEGTVKAVHNPALLKCTCPKYRFKNYCEHIHSALRKADNILYQSLVVNSATNSTTGVAIPSYMTVTLSRRSDLTTTAPEVEGGRAKFEFTQLNGNRSNQTRWAMTRRKYLRESSLHSANTGAGSYQEFKDITKISSTISETAYFQTINKMSDAIIALQKGEVTLPVVWSNEYYVNANPNSIQKTVEGTITYDQTSDRTPYIKGSNLKCRCTTYRETYDCEHIQAVKSMGLALLQTGNRVLESPAPVEGMRTGNTILNALDENGERRVDARSGYLLSDIYSEMLNIDSVQNRSSSTTSRNILQAILMQAKKNQAIRNIRTRIELEESREARRLAQRIADANRYATSLAHDINAWKDNNPERAAALVSYRENMMNKWETVDPTYQENPEIAQTAMNAAIARKAAGENPIVFREGGVLDGMSDGPAGRKFGIELEFDVPRENRNETLRKIGRELKEAGLTNTEEQQRYHSAARNGYATWSYEHDATVDAELVSPILDDSPESWEQVRKATEIITRNGGKATTRAGSHVHISTGTYENSSAKRAEILRFNREHQDLIFRLASDPKRGRHRGWRWCAPNVDDNAGELNSDINAGTSVFSGGHNSHGVAINMTAMKTNLTTSNIEYRMWDATLDAGAIQAQVMMSAAMTDYAERTVIKEGKSDVRRDIKNIGNAKSSNKDNLDLTGDTGFANFADKLFRKNEDKEQIASLFAVTNWQRSS